MNKQSSQTALITGSTRNIGKLLAHKLAKDGYSIFFTSNEGDKIGNDVVAEFQKAYSGQFFFTNADVNDSTGKVVHDLVMEAHSKLGHIDVLVNNAGIHHVAPLPEFPNDVWTSIININLSAPFFAIKTVLPLMRANNYGRIINLASAQGLVASVNKAGYVSSKHGLVGLTKTAALETAQDHNLTVNAVAPGFALTDLAFNQAKDIAKNKSISIEDAKAELIRDKHPSKRFIKPEQIVSLIHYLISDEAREVTGAIWSIDGGWTAQ